MRKPTLCGSNRINLPDSGCGDCEELEYRIKQLEDWKEEFVEEGYNALANKPTINGVTVEGDKTSEDYLILPISDADIIALTPMECYVPACQDSRVCYGETCCMIVSCNTSDSSIVCEGGVCYATVACEEPPTPPTPTPTASMEANIEVEEMETYAEGDELTVVYTITNTGDLSISNVTVTANKTASQWETEEIEVESAFEEEATYTITAEDIANGSVTFDLSAVGTAESESVTASTTLTFRFSDEPLPQGEFTLSIDATLGEESDIGSVIQVSYMVTNTGEAPITDIAVSAPNTSNAWTIANLDIGAEQEFIGYYTLTAEDVENGSVEFTLTANGTSAEEAISDTVTESFELISGDDDEDESGDEGEDEGEKK